MNRLLWRLPGVPVAKADRKQTLAAMTDGRGKQDALDFMRAGASHNTEKSVALLGAQAIFVVVDTFALEHGWAR